MSAATEAKARKYLSDGAVRVVMHDSTLAWLTVQGSDPEPYEVRYRGTWTCDCPARVTCTHILAAQLISPLRDEAPTLGVVDPEVMRLIQ